MPPRAIRSLHFASRATSLHDPRMRFRKITLAGVGLLGGSIGLAVKARGLAECVAGLVRRPESIEECRALGVTDYATLEAKEAAQDADLVVLCTPISRMRAVVDSMLLALKPGVIVTDVGSVKGCVVEELEPVAASAGAIFVGSHPMAGSEQVGPRWARASLFEGAVCVVTPSEKSPETTVAVVEEFWNDVGGISVRLSPKAHDGLVSRSSHLPHVVAAGLASHVLGPGRPREQAMLCANGFRDTTRIASGSPDMWRDIALANRHNLARALSGFIEDLDGFRRALERSDAAAVQKYFETAQGLRDQWTAGSNPAE